jgi:hypothetical protein
VRFTRRAYRLPLWLHDLIARRQLHPAALIGTYNEFARGVWLRLR